jgi:hypothetical protein
MLEPLWRAASQYGLDPVGLVAQAAKETNWGNYTGRVKPEFHNTCGLKVAPEQQALVFPDQPDPRPTADDKPLAHAMFSNWWIGAKAHAQHLCAYTGQLIGEEPVDPRYELVVNKHWCENFEDLGGKWAPAPDYGVKIVAIARRLQGAA